MEQDLLAIIGENEGDEMPFDEWRLAALQQGLQPQSIQKMKRRGLVYTELRPDGSHVIIRGQRPAPVE